SFQSLSQLQKNLNIVSQGGALGNFMGGKFLSYYLGTGGAFFLLVSVLLLFVLLLTELSLVKSSKMLLAGLKKILKGLNLLLLRADKVWKKAYKAIRERKARREESGFRETGQKAIHETLPEKNTHKVVEKESETEKKPTVFEKIKERKKPKAVVKRDTSGSSLPGLAILEDYDRDGKETEDDQRLLSKGSEILENTLAEFGLDVEVVNIQKGPAVTRYELKIAPGTKVEKISSLSNNIALAMKALSVRIIAPIPGKAAVGIEIPNAKTSIVKLKEMLESREYTERNYTVPLALGKDISGAPVVVDLTDMPHLLIAGATGSGKSVCINAIICTLLYSSTPDAIRFVLIDPKKVELSCYSGIPHLYCPIINTSQKSSLGLRLLINEMERRYELFARLGVRNIKAYQEYKDKMEAQGRGDEAQGRGDEAQEALENLPYIVIIIDELADLILVSSSDVQDSIIRLAQLSRAVGIHLVLATQRPSVKVVTGLIKANIPSRISFKLPSKVDSRTVLDANGADKLLGDGDMLFLPPGTSKLVRAQGTFVSDSEIKRIVQFWKDQTPVEYNEEMTSRLSASGGTSDEDDDDLFDEAVKIIIEAKMASASLLQRRLKIGYNRASRIIDKMEDRGIIGPHVGSKGREIYVESYDDYENLEV
ncbi:MAG: DNA translocase FtsK, partial [Candidatus Aureabacteria bacterium]|nr:DNA translocase FtsK [Candidatus Auribacterota bacterium]